MKKIEIEFGSHLILKNLTEREEQEIKNRLTFSNPQYYKVKKYSKYGYTNIPSKLYYYKSMGAGQIQVPVGFDFSFFKERIGEKITDIRVADKVEYPEFILTLRDSQKDAFDKFFKLNLNSPSINGCIQMNTGMGKSMLGLYIASALSVKTLIAVHKDDLVKGWQKDIELAFDGKITPGLIKAQSKIVGEHITIATVQTLNRMESCSLTELYDTFGLVILDECFEPDAEILTDRGFIKFKDLTPDIKIGQVHADGHLDFVSPVRVIRNYFAGEMVDFSPRKGCSILMTPEHQQARVLKNDVRISNSKSDAIKEHNGDIVFTSAKDLCYNSNKLFMLSAKGVGKKMFLSNLDRIAIALQADGTIQRHNKNDISWTIKLKKQDKISNWVKLIENISLYCNEIKSSKGYRRWYINTPKTITKDLRTYFNCIENYSFEYARDFISEIVKCDGTTNYGKPYYSCKMKYNVDFVSAVALLGGYSAYQSTQDDKRTANKVFRIYRLFLQDRLVSSLRYFDKKYKPFKGEVYCVEVPTHLIVVRTPDKGNGKQFTFISGNCHHVAASSYEIVSEFNSRYKIGLTATPERKDGLAHIMNLYFGGFCYQHVYTKDDKDILPVTVNIRELHLFFNPVCKRITRYGRTEYVIDNLFAPEDFSADKHNLIRLSDIPHEDRPKVPYHTIDNFVVNECMQYFVDDVLNEYRQGHSCIVFFTQKEHCRLFQSLLPKSLYVGSALYYGDNTDAENDEVLKTAQECRNFITITTYAKATEGTNCPQWEVAFLCSSMNDGKNTEQAVGRIRRSMRDGDKINPVRVYDYRYKGVYSFATHGRTRDERYDKLGFDVIGRTQNAFRRGYN